MTRYQNKLAYPFVCHNMPFICHRNASIYPFIWRRLPIVGIKGFTLIELIIALTIVGILAALAAPGMQNFVSSNRLTTQVNDLLADINLSRSEAIKRSTSTGVCVTASDGSSCVTSGNWANGWLVYYCTSATVPCPSSSKETIKLHEKLTGSNTLSAAGNEIAFSKSGLLSGSAVQFTLTDPKTGGKRIVCVGTTGRPMLYSTDCPT